MADDGGFLRWFVPWVQARPDNSPIGWYSVDDLAEAFRAGSRAADGRPGSPVSPPSGCRAGSRTGLGPG